MIDQNFMAAIELKAVRDVLREAAALLNKIDHGHCGICGDYRGFLDSGEVGECTNRGCLSQRMARALGDDENAN
jgi:hypothetical protein